MSDDLNMDVWLSALQDVMAHTNNSHGITVKELSESTGILDRKVRMLIAKLIGMGTVKSTKVPYRAIDGRITMVPAYIIVEKGA